MLRDRHADPNPDADYSDADLLRPRPPRPTNNGRQGVAAATKRSQKRRDAGFMSR